MSRRAESRLYRLPSWVPDVDDAIPFERYRGGHIVSVPAVLAGTEPARFVLDTGIGCALISEETCRRHGWAPTGESVGGQRMSGQTVSVPIVRLPSLSVGSVRRENVPAGVYPGAVFFPPDAGIAGFIPAQFFEPWPFAINSVTRTVRVIRSNSPDSHLGVGVEAPIEVRRRGFEVTLFLDLRLPSGRVAHLEVDTGSDNLILHSRYMRELGVDPDRPGVRTIRGKDETGYEYVRSSAEVRGEFSVAAAPSVAQRDPTVVFQTIIHDGLIGDRFLRSFDVTYDLARARLIFADPST